MPFHSDPPGNQPRRFGDHGLANTLASSVPTARRSLNSSSKSVFAFDDERETGEVYQAVELLVVAEQPGRDCVPRRLTLITGLLGFDSSRPKPASPSFSSAATALASSARAEQVGMSNKTAAPTCCVFMAILRY
jgi:hypothetical protein